MTAPESADATLIGRFGSLFRRDNRVMKITTHHVGEIRAEKSVQLSETGVIAGDVYAGELIVAGLVVVLDEQGAEFAGRHAIGQAGGDKPTR